MSLAETLELLVKAREYVAEGEEYLVDQRKIVDRLERRGKTLSTPFSSSDLAFCPD